MANRIREDHTPVSNVSANVPSSSLKKSIDGGSSVNGTSTNGKKSSMSKVKKNKTINGRN
jgi:hypothetical protein